MKRRLISSITRSTVAASGSVFPDAALECGRLDVDRRERLLELT